MKVGLIVPPQVGRVPPDATVMYPHVTFDVEGLGLRAMSAADYGEAIGRVEETARACAARGAEAVLLFGTSLSFFGGPELNAQIEQTMRQASGLPSLTLTSAMVQALDRLGARRIAAATAYAPEVDAMFRRYFEACGYVVDNVAGLGITALGEVEALDPERIAGLARTVAAQAPEADVIVLSCAGMRTTPIAAALERELGRPVISSAMVGSWAAVRLAGASGSVANMGRLYADDANSGEPHSGEPHSGEPR